MEHGLRFSGLYGASRPARNAKHFEMEHGLRLLKLYGASRPARNAEHFEMEHGLWGNAKHYLYIRHHYVKIIIKRQ
jgi:hypothetical protein